MKRCKVEVLPNGLTLVCIKTNKKFAKMASLVVKFGGFNKKVLKNDKILKIKDGTAHFLEHLLIEDSMYGNVIFEFDKNNCYANAYTNSFVTSFWFKSLYDFEENLVKLINIVNKPSFNKKGIEFIKDAIVQEKMRKDDNKYYEYYSSPYSCLFEDLKDPNVLGEVSDIRNMEYVYVKQIYDIFYRPSNQILLVNGNVNFNKIRNLVQETYKNFKYSNIEFTIPKLSLKDDIFIKEKIIKKDVPSNEVKVAIKINISKYSPVEKLKFDYYIGRYVRYRLKGLDEEIFLQNISTRGVNFSVDRFDNYYLLFFSLTTDKSLDYINLLLGKLNDKVMPKEEFDLINKQDLINLLLREDDSYGEVDPLIDNILSFDYYNIDTPELIESFDYEEFNKMIDEVDFNNYSVIKLEKESK